MKNSNLILAGVVGGIVIFLLGWVVYGMLLESYMASNMPNFEGMNKEAPDMLPLFIGNLSLGFLLALIMGQWGSITTAGAGAMTGLIVGLLTALGIDLIFMGTTNLMNAKILVADVIAWVIMFSIAGAIEAMILGRKAKSA